MEGVCVAAMNLAGLSDKEKHTVVSSLKDFYIPFLSDAKAEVIYNN
jgi:hypothetical protein